MNTNIFSNNLPEIIKQLESCGYNCEAGSLQNNVAFIELKRMADNLEEATLHAKAVWGKEPVDTIEKGYIQTVALKFLELSKGAETWICPCGWSNEITPQVCVGCQQPRVDTNPPTCPNCGGQDWHHSVECYLGQDLRPKENP